VHMKIDKTRRKIFPTKINNAFPTCTRLLPNCDNFSFFHNDFEAVADSIWKNQTRVTEYHVSAGAMG